MPGRPLTRMRKLLAAQRGLCEAFLHLDGLAPEAVRDGRYGSDRLGEPWRKVHDSLRRLVDDLDRLNLRAAEAWRCPDPAFEPDCPLSGLSWLLDDRAGRAAAFDAGETPQEAPAVAWLREQGRGRGAVIEIEPHEERYE